MAQAQRGTLFTIAVSHLTRGPERFNLAQGTSAAGESLDVALSNGVAGSMVNALGYSAAFYCLAVCTARAFAIYGFAVPESLDFKPDGSEAKLEGALVLQRAGA